MMNLPNLAAQLAIDEGRRTKVYADTVGKMTVGVGRNVSDRPFSSDERALMYKNDGGKTLPIAARTFSDDEIDMLLENDIDIVMQALDFYLPWWRARPESCQQVMANMCFNLGINRFLGFKNAIRAMNERRYDDAAREMLESTWAKQVGARATRLADLIRTGA